MVRIRSKAAFLIVSALLLVFVDAARASAGSAPLFLLAENVASESQAPSEESTPQQEIPVVDPNNDATPPQPQPAADQQGQPPGEHEQDPEPEPEPAPQPSPRQ